jgi:antitoxin HicB
MAIPMRYVYPVRLVRDSSGRILAKFPDVPEALTDGADCDEALVEAQDALVAALSGYVRERRSIPAPSVPRRGQHPVYLPPLVAAKIALYQAMRKQGVSNMELARRLGLTEAVVRRLVDPDHGSRIEKIEIALRVLGRRLVVEAA